MAWLRRACLVALVAIGLLTGGGSLPVQARGLLAEAPTDLETHSLVLPGSDIPGDWELIDQQSLKAGDQELDLYHEIQTPSSPPGRIVGLAVARFADPASAATSLDNSITQARNAGQPGWTLDNLGDGPAVAFVYRVAETQLRERFGFDSDALGETVMVRVDRYLLTVQVGGQAAALPDVDKLAAQLSELQISRVRGALATLSP